MRQPSTAPKQYGNRFVACQLWEATSNSCVVLGNTIQVFRLATILSVTKATVHETVGCLRYTHYLGYAVLEPRVGIVSQCNLHSLLIVQGTSPCFTRIRSQKMIRQPPYRRLRKPELCSIVMLSCWFTSTFKVSNRWRWSWW